MATFLVRKIAKFTTSWINHNSGDAIGPLYNYKKVALFCFWDGQTFSLKFLLNPHLSLNYCDVICKFRSSTFETSDLNL